MKEDTMLFRDKPTMIGGNMAGHSLSTPHASAVGKRLSSMLRKNKASF